MGRRPRHTSKEIEAVLQYAEALGWRVLKRKNSHAWARLLCANADQTGCQISVNSTPKNAHNHAKTIRKLIDKCTCEAQENE
jgi:predicted RNA binding protein YcfA (HicA-like mRNA interferase family)